MSDSVRRWPTSTPCPRARRGRGRSVCRCQRGRHGHRGAVPREARAATPAAEVGAGPAPLGTDRRITGLETGLAIGELEGEAEHE